MGKKEIGVAVFGAFDGLSTALGIVLGSAHLARQALLTVAVCVSLTGALSMGAGEFLEDTDVGFRLALIMAMATLVGTFIPNLPILLLHRPQAYTVTAVLALLFAGVAAEVRSRGGSRKRAYFISYVSLFVVAIPTILVAIALGTSGA